MLNRGISWSTSVPILYRPDSHSFFCSWILHFPMHIQSVYKWRTGVLSHWSNSFVSVFTKEGMFVTSFGGQRRHKWLFQASGWISGWYWWHFVCLWLQQSSITIVIIKYTWHACIERQTYRFTLTQNCVCVSTIILKTSLNTHHGT